MIKLKHVVVAFLILPFFLACKKDPGAGGKATIKGRLFVRNYNSDFTLLLDQYYIQGENVYITYGDETVVGDNVKTSYDGSFEFPYLRKGKYKVFAVSKDSTSASATKAIIKEIEITKTKQVVVLPDIIIIN